MNRDGKGRFVKKKGKIILILPSLKNIFFYLVLVVVIFFWILIILRLNKLPDIIAEFEEIMPFPINNKEFQKKDDIFY